MTHLTTSPASPASPAPTGGGDIFADPYLDGPPTPRLGLLALRDPSLAPEYLSYQAEFAADLSAVVVQIVAVAGRRFVIPAGEAIALLTSIYDQALRMAILTGGESAAAAVAAAGGAEAGARGGVSTGLGERVAELLFALTVVNQSL